MKYHIKNPTHRAKAFKVHGGMEEIGPKSEGTVDVTGDLTDEFISLQALEGVIITPVGDETGKAPAKAEPAKAEPEQPPAAKAGTYEAVDAGRGWFKIHDATGKVVGKSMREDDANAFNAMSDADRAAAVAEMED
ncbi:MULTISPECIES: hypothetical protein [unclassified Aurantimonas]|uniref:hypothetical protein n=1 Tax=unclassified Aurantimonas TaxID=2638230 RepID=UPI002E19C0B3|nr:MULTISPECIES: hypothetical protein [unclassified Aurantimonas]MEC5289391.1 hypothetical protein [Aurantimonas sp. C2-3-R2]MEC5410471.1 hypothetical protein [Aurantimonas sp. C2-4-R8]